MSRNSGTTEMTIEMNTCVSFLKLSELPKVINVVCCITENIFVKESWECSSPSWVFVSLHYEYIKGCHFISVKNALHSHSHQQLKIKSLECIQIEN